MKYKAHHTFNEIFKLQILPEIDVIHEQIHLLFEDLNHLLILLVSYLWLSIVYGAAWCHWGSPPIFEHQSVVVFGCITSADTWFFRGSPLSSAFENVRMSQRCQCLWLILTETAYTLWLHDAVHRPAPGAAYDRLTHESVCDTLSICLPKPSLAHCKIGHAGWWQPSQWHVLTPWCLSYVLSVKLLSMKRSASSGVLRWMLVSLHGAGLWAQICTKVGEVDSQSLVSWLDRFSLELMLRCNDQVLP